MAQSKENQLTFGRGKNSTFYVAGNVNSFDKCVESEVEAPVRNSVQQIRSIFEKPSLEQSEGKSQQFAFVQTRNVKPLSQCDAETQNSFERASETRQEENQNFPNSENSQTSLHTQNRSSGDSAGPNVNVNNPKLKSDMNISDEENSKVLRPGSLLVQPASNVRGPLVKPEYLRLNRFIDITVYSGPKKRSKVSVDELDKRIDERLSEACVDETSVDNSFDDIGEIQSMEDSDSVYEFEGAGIRVDRPALKISKSHEKKQVSFSHHPASVFEYPSEQDTLASEKFDSEASNWRSISEGHDAFQEKVVTKALLQSNPVCNGTGYLGLYQPRLLEQCSVIPFYSADMLQDSSTALQSEAVISQQMEKFKAKSAAVGSCSAEESSWSGGNSGTELLF